MNRVIYAIFFLMAFSNTSILGHIYLVEIPVVIGALMLPFHRDQKALSFNLLDRLVLTYAVFSLISVAVGIDSLYESARHYRLMVLTPVLIYLVIRFGSSSLEQLRKAAFFILPGTFWQGGLLLQYYILYGSRPVGVEGAVSTITLSVLISISLFLMIFNFKVKPKPVMNAFRYGLIILLFFMLVVTGTRAALIGFVVMVVAIIFVWNLKSRRVWIGRGMLISISMLLILVISGSIIFAGIKIDNVKEKSTSVERVFDLDMLLWDLSGRIDFWGRITNNALENPFFGSGGASHSIGTSGGTDFKLGSAHNVLVSTLVTSGVPGLIILLSLIWAVYQVFKVIDNETLKHFVLGKSVLASVSVLLMVAITNDFSGGRIFIWLLLLAIAARMLNELPRVAATKEQQGGVTVGDTEEAKAQIKTSGVRLR
ncbi:MAG: O-antigen ligase family protein [Pseudomonadota bacterium]